MSKRSEEKAKHLASYLSSLSNTLFNVGVFAPVMAYLFNVADFQTRVSLKLLLVVTISIMILATVAFLFARKKLEELPDVS